MIPLGIMATKNKKAAKALAERIVPHVADRFTFEEMKDESGKDVFELETLNGKIRIRGNSANSMAVGLNHYLKYYCKTSVS